MPQLKVDTGMDTKPVLMGVKEINSAVRSLTSFVNQAGKGMNASVVGFAKAMRNNAEASREAKARVGELNTIYKDLISRVDELANAKIDTEEYSKLKKEINSVESAQKRLNEQRDKMVSLGRDAKETKEYSETKNAILKQQTSLEALYQKRNEMNSALVDRQSEQQELGESLKANDEYIKELKARQKELSLLASRKKGEVYNDKARSEESAIKNYYNSWISDYENRIAELEGTLATLPTYSRVGLKAPFDEQSIKDEIELYEKLIERAKEAKNEKLAAFNAKIKNTDAYQESEKLNKEAISIGHEIEDAQADSSGLSRQIVTVQADINQYKSQMLELDKAIDGVKANLAQLLEKQSEMEKTGNDKQMSESMKALQYEINKNQELLEKLRETKKELEESGKATVSGKETDAYGDAISKADAAEEQLRNAVKNAESNTAPLHVQEWNKMATATGAVANGLARVQYAGQMVGQILDHPFQALNRLIPIIVSGLGRVVSALGSLAQKALNAAMSFAKMVASNVISFIRRLGIAALDAAKSLAKMAGQAIVSGIKNIGSLAAKAGKAILSVGKSAKRGNTSLKQAVTMLIRYGFGVRSIFMLVRRLRTALVDAFKNMAQAVPEVNVVMSKLSASLGQLKNSLATAFQPVLSAIAPLLNTFMEMLTETMTRVGMFFAALTGQDYVYKAKKANVDLAKSLDKTKKSAKEAENQLAGFDHLNILKAPNDSGSNSGADANAADSGGFQQIPLLESIKNFADKLKNMLLNGEFAELGKVLAEKVNGLFNSIDLRGIAQKLGGLINNAVAFYNAFMEGIDWDNIGKKFASGINGLLDSVNWSELGKALSQRINAIWGIIYGLVSDVDWVGAGRALAEAVWGYLGNIDWDKIGKTIGLGINGISAAIIKFATTFPWKEMGAKVASGLNNLFDTANLKWLVEAFIKTLNGALDTLLEIVGGFKWGENGEKFRLAVLDLIENFPAEKLGHLLQISLKGILDLMAPTISDPKIWANLGSRLGSFLNSLFGDKEMWKTIGTIANGMLNSILIFGQSFLATFKEDEAAENIKTALAQIDFEGIATNTWNLIKTAFAKAGSFVDALFSETMDNTRAQIDPAYVEKVMAFNNKSVGERIGQRIREALFMIPWADIASSMWETAKGVFKNAGDFVSSLFNVSDDDIRNAGGNKALATGRKIGELFSNAISKIKWDEFGNLISTAVTNLFSVISGFFQEIATKDEDGKTKLQKAVEDFFSGIDWYEVAKSIVTAAADAFYALGTSLFNLILDGMFFSSDKQAQDNLSEKLQNLTESAVEDIDSTKAKVDFQQLMFSIVEADGSYDLIGSTYSQQFYDGFMRYAADENGRVRDEFRPYLTEILGGEEGVALFESGAEEYVEAFYESYKNTAYQGAEENKEAWNGVITSFVNVSEASAEGGKNAADSAIDAQIQEANARASEIEETSKTIFAPDVSDVAEEGATNTANAAVDGYTQSMQGRKYDVDEANKTLVFPDMSEPAKQNAEKTANDSMSAYIGLLLSRQPNDETAVQNVFNTIWGAIDAGGNGEMLALGYMSEFLNTVTDESGRVKPEFKNVVEGMFGSVDAVEKSGITAQDFMKGLIQGMWDSSGETSTKLVEIIDSILTDVETSPDGFEQGSPSKRAARSGQYYMEGLQNGIDDNADATETTMTNAMNRVVGVVDDKWNEVTETQGKYLRGMEGNTSTGMTNITNDVAAGTTDQRQPVYDNWDLIATFVRLTLEGMKTDVQSAMNSMLSAMQSGMSSMKSAVESGVNGIGNSLSNGMGSVVNAVNGIDWWSVGDNIVAGIQDGMIDNWKYLKSTAKTLANNLLISTKNALGIASPSRLFRDEVGVMLGLGIAEGMEDSQPAIISSVSDVADAMVDKMNGTDMAFNVGTDAALDSFSDKITNSFTTLLDRLQSIADRVTFQTPTIATGTVLPYNVQAQSANGSKDIVNALEVSNDDLANVIIQATNNAVSALVEAIRRSGNTSGGDLNSQTSRIIDEINRRTRAQGTSPIIV